MKFRICLFAGVLLLLTTAGCKKVIDKAKENALYDYMVSKTWLVQQYISDTTDVTAEFSGFEFQFYRDNTVLGTRGTSVRQTGTWSTNIDNVTITAQFVNSPNPLPRLNGTWGVASYNSNGPVFSQTINGVVVKLILKEK